MITFHEAWAYVYNHLWSEDPQGQAAGKVVVEENTRKIKGYKGQSLYIPSSEYFLKYFKAQDLQEFHGYFFSDVGECLWAGYHIYPVIDVYEEVVAIIGFSLLKYLLYKKTGDKSLHYYSYTHKSITQVGKYGFWGSLSYTRVKEEGYIILVDGFYDAIHLQTCGLNGVALLGSILNDVMISIIRTIKNVVVICDRDNAGELLYNDLRSCIPKVRRFFVVGNKDVDGMLKADDSGQNLHKLKKFITECSNIPIP